ncbi:hypothetical protein [Bartonella sp. B39]
MIKLLKNYVLSIFVAVAFFLSQIVNVNANHLRSSPQRGDVSVFVMGQEKKKEISTAAFYVPSLNYRAESQTDFEGKIERVFEPITLGFFTTLGALGFGALTGSVMAVVTAVIGWAIGKIKVK